MKTWANGGDGVSALALLAEVSGAVPVAFTVATIKKKIQCVQRFLQRLYGFTEYLQPGCTIAASAGVGFAGRGFVAGQG